jgi:ABC-type multidrug transport system ATPase subunit
VCFYLLQRRTTITVAHRLSSVAHCDKILVLQKGRVVEQGTHAELMRIAGGVYRNMWNIQNHVVNQKNSVDGLYGGEGSGGTDDLDELVKSVKSSPTSATEKFLNVVYSAF